MFGASYAPLASSTREKKHKHNNILFVCVSQAIQQAMKAKSISRTIKQCSFITRFPYRQLNACKCILTTKYRHFTLNRRINNATILPWTATEVGNEQLTVCTERCYPFVHPTRARTNTCTPNMLQRACMLFNVSCLDGSMGTRNYDDQ